MNIDENIYLAKVHDKDNKRNKCNTDKIITNDFSTIISDISKNIIEKKDIEYAGTYVLEKFLFYQTEFNNMPFDTIKLQKARVISVNPGSDNIGREQKFVHFYIVLAEYNNMFIGVPITNMAFDEKENKYVLRNPFEVELINPSSNIKDKPYYQYWVNKPSVADLRNIAGLDKRRILVNNLYKEAKFAPDSYMNPIKQKLKEILSI